MTPAGIEPATYRIVAQHLNHCATIHNITKSAMGLKVQVFWNITPCWLVEYLATIRKTVLSQFLGSCKMLFSRTIINTTMWTTNIAYFSCVWSWSVGFVWQKEARILLASVRLERRSEPARIISFIFLSPVRSKLWQKERSRRNW